MNLSTLKTIALSIAFSCPWLLAHVAHANSVNLTLQNSTPDVLRLLSSSHNSQFPTTLGPGQILPISFTFGGTSSEVSATYRRVGAGTTCRFSASHVVHISGPRFFKNATSIGENSATCLTFQSPKWKIPYSYTATFAFYY